MTDELNGRTALVTGATSGIGKITALELARMGARVLVHGRNPVKIEAVVAELRATSAGQVEGIRADFASLADVRALAAEVRTRTDRLHILVNNAGGAAARRRLSPDGIELTLATNHLAPFLLTNLLLDLFKASAPARIVNVASEAHRVGMFDFDDLQSERRYRSFKVYGHSKMQNILFTYALARRLAGSGVTVTAVHPGAVDTGIWNAAQGMVRPIVRVMQWFMISPERGAAPLIRLASATDVSDVTGVYFKRFKPARSADPSNDVAVQERLWDVSARLTGLVQASSEDHR
ncbi:MAG TPA: SDR family oxidoreductase [Gemmatimonadales bacterium]|nr:SDR family oxidoreductase [Gemmatimonadales bacterium]